MKKLTFFISVFCVRLAVIGHAEAAESVEIETETGRVVTAQLAVPESDAKAVGVIVTHENRGLTDWVTTVAERLAENGFVAIAPDLLSGEGPNGGGTNSFASSDDARTAISALNPDPITNDLKAVTNYLHEQRSVAQVSVSGFCWGWTQSFRFATNAEALSAAYVFYGSGPSADDIARITAPVYGFYAENDNRIN